jgi:hypothetical protein
MNNQKFTKIEAAVEWLLDCGQSAIVYAVFAWTLLIAGFTCLLCGKLSASHFILIGAGFCCFMLAGNVLYRKVRKTISDIFTR